jgi:hypothetical protein
MNSLMIYAAYIAICIALGLPLWLGLVLIGVHGLIARQGAQPSQR